MPLLQLCCGQRRGGESSRNLITIQLPVWYFQPYARHGTVVMLAAVASVCLFAQGAENVHRNSLQIKLGSQLIGKDIVKFYLSLLSLTHSLAGSG